MDRPANFNALVEEHYVRAYRFWTQRNVPIAWPIEPRGYTFLGRAVHLVGEALFSDWTGDEPAEFHLPALESGEFHEASENERIFARAILRKHDAAALRDGEHAELSNTEWERALELYCIHVLPNIMAARRKFGVLMRTIIEAAAHQKLVMATRNSIGLPVASPPAEWTTEWAYPRFAECQMNPLAPFVNMHPRILFGARLPGDRMDRIPGNQWIFVETESLEALLSSLSGLTTKSRSLAPDEPIRRNIRQRVGNEVLDNNLASKRRSPQREKVIAIFEECFPSGLPDRNEMNDTEFVESVGKCMKAKGRSVPGRDTILRAANRRKDAI